jgi:hypothetical protein
MCVDRTIFEDRGRREIEIGIAERLKPTHVGLQGETADLEPSERVRRRHFFIAATKQVLR